MANNIDVQPGERPGKVAVSTIEIDGVHYPTYIPVDVTGNPLSTYYDPLGDRYMLDVHDADVHTFIINKLIYQSTAITTTLTTAITGDGTEYEIDVADATGFAVDDSINIDTSTVESTYPKITAISSPTGASTFTLDRRLDKAHLIGDSVTKIITDMSSQAGTMASPQIYSQGPENGVVWHLTRLLFSMELTSAGDLGLFGNIGALTNGVLLRAKINGQYGNLTDWKINADMKSDMYDVEFDARSGGGGTHGVSGRGTFLRAGAVLRLDGSNGDKFELLVQDDITGLTSFEMKLQGHIEGA